MSLYLPYLSAHILPTVYYDSADDGLDSILCETLSSSLHSPFVYGLVVAQLFLRVQKMSRIDSGLSRL